MKKTCNHAAGSQNPEKQPALAVGKQSNGKSRVRTLPRSLSAFMFSLRPEFLQQPLVAERFYVHVFLWVGDNPAVPGLGLQWRVFLGQVAPFLELRGKVG